MGRQSQNKNIHTRAPNVLYGYVSLYLHQALPEILTKKPFSFRRNTQTMKGQPGALYPDGSPKLFTYEMAYDLGVDRTGQKEVVLNRIRDFLVANPIKIPPMVAQRLNPALLQPAKQNDAQLSTLLEDYKVQQDADKAAGKTSPPAELPLELLFLYHQNKRLGLVPTSEQLVCEISGLQVDKAAVEPVLAEINTHLWAAVADPSSNLIVQRRSASCPLRLFTIMLVDNKHCKRLLYDMPATFWQDVCNTFKTDSYQVPGIPVEDPVFLDPTTKDNLDISKCQSRWVHAETLANWYDTTHMLLAAAKKQFFETRDTTKIDLKTLDGIKVFIQDIHKGPYKKYPFLIQMILLAWWRWKTDDVIAAWFAPPTAKIEGNATAAGGVVPALEFDHNKLPPASTELLQQINNSIVGGVPLQQITQQASVARLQQQQQQKQQQPVHVSTGRGVADFFRQDEKCRAAAALEEEVKRNEARFKRATGYLELSKTLPESKRQKKLEQISYALIDKVIEVECQQLGINLDDLADNDRDKDDSGNDASTHDKGGQTQSETVGNVMTEGIETTTV